MLLKHVALYLATAFQDLLHPLHVTDMIPYKLTLHLSPAPCHAMKPVPRGLHSLLSATHELCTCVLSCYRTRGQVSQSPTVQ